MNETKLTKSTRAVLRFYLGLNQERFRLPLDVIAMAALGADPEKPNDKTKTVQRANSRLRDLDILSWIPGHGPGTGGLPARPNEYRIDPLALRIYRRKMRQETNHRAEVAEAVNRGQ